MAPPPKEVERAEEALSADDTKSYTLVASKAAMKDAAEFNLKLTKNDIPLFVADRLAFAGPKGAQEGVEWLKRDASDTKCTPQSHNYLSPICRIIIASSLFGKGRLRH